MDFTLTDEQELLVDTARALFVERVPRDRGARRWRPTPTGRRPRCSTATSATGSGCRPAARRLAGRPDAVPRRGRRRGRSGTVPGHRRSVRPAARRGRPRPGRRRPRAARSPARWPSPGPDGVWQRQRRPGAHAGDRRRPGRPRGGGAARPVAGGGAGGRPRAHRHRDARPGPPMLDVDVPAGSDRRAARCRGARTTRSSGRAVAVSAELVGVARWLLDTSVAYAKERVQFGKPIGSFQAIQHKLVEHGAGLRGGRRGGGLRRDVHRRRRPRSSPGRPRGQGDGRPGRPQGGRDGLQVHGGIGFTWEHDLHLRLRRAYADDALCGTHEWHLDRLADLIMGRAAKGDTGVR